MTCFTDFPFRYSILTWLLFYTLRQEGGLVQYAEQRKFKRYHPPDGAIAMLRPFKEFGLINNISKGGMAFEYLEMQDETAEVPEIGPRQQIDIFVPGKNARPMTFTCKVVRVEERLMGSYTHSVVPKKRCCIEFVKMEKEISGAFDAFLVQCRKCKPAFVEGMGIIRENLH